MTDVNQAIFSDGCPQSSSLVSPESCGEPASASTPDLPSGWGIRTCTSSARCSGEPCWARRRSINREKPSSASAGAEGGQTSLASSPRAKLPEVAWGHGAVGWMAEGPLCDNRAGVALYFWSLRFLSSVPVGTGMWGVTLGQTPANSVSPLRRRLGYKTKGTTSASIWQVNKAMESENPAMLHPATRRQIEISCHTPCIRPGV